MSKKASNHSPSEWFLGYKKDWHVLCQSFFCTVKKGR